VFSVIVDTLLCMCSHLQPNQGLFRVLLMTALAAGIDSDVEWIDCLLLMMALGAGVDSGRGIDCLMVVLLGDMMGVVGWWWQR
jgi:hypothetical protein